MRCTHAFLSKANIEGDCIHTVIDRLLFQRQDIGFDSITLTRTRYMKLLAFVLYTKASGLPRTSWNASSSIAITRYAFILNGQADPRRIPV